MKLFWNNPANEFALTPYGEEAEEMTVLRLDKLDSLTSLPFENVGKKLDLEAHLYQLKINDKILLLSNHLHLTKDKKWRSVPRENNRLKFYEFGCEFELEIMLLPGFTSIKVIRPQEEQTNAQLREQQVIQRRKTKVDDRGPR